MKNKNIKFHKSRANQKRKPWVIDLRPKGGKIMSFDSYELANKHYHRYEDKIEQDEPLTKSFDWTFDTLFNNEKNGYKVHEKPRIAAGEILEDTYIKKVADIKSLLNAKVEGVRFGGSKVKDLNLGYIKLKLFPVLKANGVKGKERSHKTLKAYKTALNGLLTFAILIECIAINPQIGFKLFKNKKLEFMANLKPKHQKIAPGIVKKIVDKLPVYRPFGCSMQLIANFALQTGARAGEHRGLTWDNVDFKNNLAHIVTALHRVSKEERTKTDQSVRSMPLSSDMISSLKELWLQQGKPKGTNFVFPKNEKGSIALNIEEDMSSWNGFLKRACGDAEVDPIRWNDLRHYFASKMLQKYPGDIWKVSRKMGHGNIKITQETYGHWIEDKEQKLKDQEDMNEMKWY